MKRINELNKLARFIHYILGLNPDEFGLVPDEKGYVKIKELIKVLHEEPGWRHIRKSHINEIRLTLTDPLFHIHDSMIRAADQDRLPEKMAAGNKDLPKLLFTAIRSRAWPHVAAHGLKPSGGMPYILLFKEKTMAERIGRRTDQNPILVSVNSSLAQKKDVDFFVFGNHLFLSTDLPKTCISGPPVPKDKLPHKTKANPKKDEKKRSTTPGSYFPDLTGEAGKDKPFDRKNKSKTTDWKRQRRSDKRRSRHKWPDK